ncbi:hypothetical protein GCM10010211_81640 [Streptomyces albospinus]|uniref:Uncharacterized protein n=1 Tax=Streptomyces albospinus TaxID=285515 RepID=A0ABQ2VP46_9ACTN|nr:hypothetical protein GCM10010211_81640 [Streptomyces albospinus]
MERSSRSSEGAGQGVSFAEVVESLPQFLAFGFLAGFVAGEDPDAACFGEIVDRPVEQLPLR